MSAKDLQKSLEYANISADESTIRKTLNKKDVHARTPRKLPLLSKKNIAASLKFAKEHLDVPQRYWQNILWTDETKVELFGRNTQHYVWRIKGTAHQHQNLISTGCFDASACYHRRKNEFLSLSRHFAEKMIGYLSTN